MHITRSIITFADFQVVILPKYCPVYNHTQLCELAGSVYRIFPKSMEAVLGGNSKLQIQ